MGYTIINNSALGLVRGLPFKASLSLTSSHPSPISEITFECLEAGISKRATRSEMTGTFDIEIPEDETIALKAGKHFYSIGIEYEDGTAEAKPYTGKISIQDPAELGGEP